MGDWKEVSPSSLTDSLVSRTLVPLVDLVNLFSPFMRVEHSHGGDLKIFA
jgi:hypothetical protein